MNCLSTTTAPDKPCHDEPRDDSPGAKSRRRTWAQLLQHVFQIDILNCHRCGGKMEIIAAIRSRASLVAILESLDLPTDAPVPAPARPLPQQYLFGRGPPRPAPPDAANNSDPPFQDHPA